MNAQLDLGKTIRRWDNRRRLVLSMTWLPRGLLSGVVVGLIIAAISRWQPWLLPNEILRATVAAVAVCAVLVLLGVWARPRSALWLAQYFDLRFGLKERLSTALELAMGRIPSAGELTDYQFNDAQAAAAQVNVRERLPFKWNTIDWGLLIIAVLLLGLSLWWDNPFNTEINEQRDLQNALAQQQEALENTREEILSDESLSEVEQQQLLEPIDQALEALENPDISREEAVASLSEAEQALEEYSDGLSSEEEAAIQNAGEALSQAEASDEVGEAMSNNDLGSAADELNELGEDLQEGNVSPEDQQALADQLDQAADALQNTNPEAADALRDAAEALRNGDPQAAQEALDRASEALRNQQEQAATSPQAQAAQQAQEQVEESREEMTGQNNQQQGQQQAQNNQQQQQQSGQQGQQGQQQQQSGQQGQQGQQQQQQSGQQGQQGQQQQQSGQQGQQGQQQQQSGQQGQQQSGQQGQQQSDQQGQPGQTGQQGQPQAGQQGQPQQGQGQAGQAQGGAPSQSGGQAQQGQAGQGQSSSQASQGSAQSAQNAGGSGQGQGGAGTDSQTGQQNNQGINTDNAPGQNEGLQDYDAVYAPQHIGNTGQQTDVELNGHPNDENSPTPPIREGDFNEDFEDSAQVPYQNVYADYENAVNEALESDYIPLGLKDVIRDYFTSLEP